STTQTPIFTATTTTTPTTLPPPPQQQSITELELAGRVVTLEKKLFDLEQNNKNLDNTTRNLGSRVYTLELRDLPYKINEAVCENVKEVVQIALQAPLRYRFKDLSEEDMKEMLHQRMFKTGSYKSLPEHIALYEALEASMERAQRDEFLTEKDKSRKRLRDDQDPPPPPPDSDLKDTNSARLLKTKQRQQWLKPIPDNERLATPKPAWVIPISHIPDAVNNWANALATTYQAPTENSLLEKTGDMQTFMNWYCRKIGNTELTQADLEGQAYEFVKPVYLDIGSRQALSISKMKAARYHDFGLELLVPEHMWIDDVCTYDISASYGLQKLVSNLLGSDIRMLSTAVKLWTRNLVIRQQVEDFQLGIESYQMQLNLTKPGWDATGFEFKHDYTIIDSPRVVVFPVSNNEQKIMRFNEIYKFNDGTLTNIMEALDYRVKEYKVNRLNPSMNTWFWTDKDVERSKEFIHAIERRLKTIRIFRNLECFVGGRVHDIDYRLL
ncbi:hypothetical protein Tco_0097434, partial [Tanacetum coccineum]